MDRQETGLKPSEWIFGFAMLMFVFSILWIAHISSSCGLKHLSCCEKPAAASFIDIEVTGCVEQNQRITMPPGSRICDLKERIILSEDADSSFFKRRRRLKNNDVIYVPSKRCRKM